MDKCNQLFWNGVTGNVENVKHPNHLYWNYQYYWNETLAQKPRKSVLAVRQESLAQDLQDLEQFLATGSAGTIDNETPLRFHLPDSVHFVSRKVSTHLMTKQQQNKLCCTLFPEEWPVYAVLIQRAENLSMPQKISTLQNAWQDCGVEKHPADIETIFQSTPTLQDWSQVFMGDVCQRFYADDDSISKEAAKV
jgi:hypothetical protein